MKVDDLISSFVPNEDHERTMVLFDIIIDENRNTLVKLLPHAEGIVEDEGGQKIVMMTGLNIDKITTWLSAIRGILAPPS
jgi:hypothetical protein